MALLNDTDPESAAILASRIGSNIREVPFTLVDGTAISIDATVTCVCAPTDGDSLHDLMAAARTRLTSQSGNLSPQRVH